MPATQIGSSFSECHVPRRKALLTRTGHTYFKERELVKIWLNPNFKKSMKSHQVAWA